MYLRMCLQDKPEAPPGTKFIYSNRGYAVLGTIAERLTAKPYETLMRDMLLKPLGMTTAGFGPMGIPGRVDQPLQHQPGHIPVEPEPLSDNPPAIAPASRVHCSIGDWAKYIKAHLRYDPSLLTQDSWNRLHTPLPGTDYFAGWRMVDRPWGGGRVLTHDGSNTQNYAVVWMAPKKDFAVLVVTNEGGHSAEAACDDAASALIRRFLK